MPYRPISQIGTGAPVIFPIVGSGSDLRQMVLQLALRIKTTVGDPVTEQDSVASVNLTLHFVFKDLNISVGGKVDDQLCIIELSL